MDFPVEFYQESVPTLVRERWEIFAARAWREFQASGQRGALVMTYADVFRLGIEAVSLQLPYAKFPDHGELTRILQIYNPEHQVVVVLASEDVLKAIVEGVDWPAEPLDPLLPFMLRGPTTTREAYEAHARSSS